MGKSKFNILNTSNSNSNNISNNEIHSDFSLVFNLIKEIIIYILLLIPYLLMLIFAFLTENKENNGNTKKYAEKIFIEPFKIVEQISKWLFEAEITAYLSITLIFIFIIQSFYLNYNETLINNLMTHQLHIFSGNFWSILTSIFLHANISHLFFNLLALIIFGRIVEKKFGLTTLWIFLGSGVIANIISHIISFFQSNFYYSLGASGGIAGLILFAILLHPFSFTSFFVIPLPIFLVGWSLIIGDVIGFTSPPSQTNYSAHLGGYMALLIIFFFLEIKHRKEIIKGFVINLVMLILFFIASIFFDISWLIL